MLFPLDSIFLSPNRKEYIVFDFIDESNTLRFPSVASISKRNGIRIITVTYSKKMLEQNNLNGSRVFHVSDSSVSDDMYLTYQDLKKLYLSLNNINLSASKTLGVALESGTRDEYQGIIMSKVLNRKIKDDTGKPIIQSILGNNETHGFDVDLIEPTSWTIVEFLKRNSSYVNNLNAHPMRYTKNIKKFESLWNFSQKFNGKLYLVNYSDNENEDLSIIEVKRFINKAFKSDVGYKVTTNQYLQWLSMLNSTPKIAERFLNTMPKEIRDENFWRNWPRNSRELGKHYESKI